MILYVVPERLWTYKLCIHSFKKIQFKQKEFLFRFFKYTIKSNIAQNFMSKVAVQSKAAFSKFYEMKQFW